MRQQKTGKVEASSEMPLLGTFPWETGDNAMLLNVHPRLQITCKLYQIPVLSYVSPSVQTFF